MEHRSTPPVDAGYDLLGLIERISRSERSELRVGPPVGVAVPIEKPPSINQMKLSGPDYPQDMGRKFTLEPPISAPTESLGNSFRTSSLLGHLNSLPAWYRARCTTRPNLDPCL